MTPSRNIDNIMIASLAYSIFFSEFTAFICRRNENPQKQRFPCLFLFGVYFSQKISQFRCRQDEVSIANFLNVVQNNVRAEIIFALLTTLKFLTYNFSNSICLKRSKEEEVRQFKNSLL